MLPATVPGVLDHGTAAALQPRWDRVRSLLTTAVVRLPALVFLLCVAQLVLAWLVRGTFAWWLALPLAGAAVPALILLSWFRGPGLRVPGQWTRRYLLLGLLAPVLGGIPAYAMAAAVVTAPGQLLALLLAVAAWIPVPVGVSLVGKAVHALRWPLVPELGSCSLPIEFGLRFTATTALFGAYTAGVWIGDDHLRWHAREVHRATFVPERNGTIPFADLGGAVATAIPAGAPPQPWLPLDSATMLHAPPGPVVSLRLRTGDWLLPVNEAALFVEILNRRIALWSATRAAGPAR